MILIPFGFYFLTEKGAELKGFTNHLWNGITTLEWCKQVENYLVNRKKGDDSGKLIQLGTQKYKTKYEMLLLFQEVYKTEFIINEFATPQAVDKRLYPDIEAKPLKEQLVEMKEFCSLHF